jgi:hypothetical protein
MLQPRSLAVVTTGAQRVKKSDEKKGEYFSEGESGFTLSDLCRRLEGDL